MGRQRPHVRSRRDTGKRFIAGRKVQKKRKSIKYGWDKGPILIKEQTTEETQY